MKRALSSLALLGYAEPLHSLKQLRSHLQQQASEPLAAVRELMQSHRLLCLGEMHDFAGRYLLPELVATAAEAGAQWLFLEVYVHEQAQVDHFVQTGNTADLPESMGGGDEPLMQFQQPYVDMLHRARQLGLRMVAIDLPDADLDERNWHMAQAIAACLNSAPDSRGVAVVGQLHLVPRPMLGHGDSMSTLLRNHWGGSLVTVGRAVPDAMPQFSVWSDVAAVRQPKLLAMNESLFATLPATHYDETLVGSDFDHLLFYPASAALGRPPRRRPQRPTKC
jgi:hypothetical protein